MQTDLSNKESNSYNQKNRVGAGCGLAKSSGFKFIFQKMSLPGVVV